MSIGTRRMTLAFTGASGLPFGLRLLACLFGGDVRVRRAPPAERA